MSVGEGPCVDATTGGTPVPSADLEDPGEGTAGRWPIFVSEANRIDVRAVFAFPIRLGAVTLGSMDLYRGPWPVVPRSAGWARAG